MSNIEAVILDWAGTTVDYGCFAPVGAFIEAFKDYGITPTVEEVRKPMGMLKRDHIKAMLSMERISAEWNNIYSRSFTEADIDSIYEKSEKAIIDTVANYTEIKPYVVKTVEKLKEMGIKIGSTTGYTDKMMEIVVKNAEEKGYSPDCWFSPNSVENMGRPYPYMIFENLKKLNVLSVSNVIKVGDTVADIKEGINAGTITIGVIEGSSIMALSEKEFNSLTDDEKEKKREQVRNVFLAEGADYVINDIRGLIEIIEDLND